jgi:hypothetical protein
VQETLGLVVLVWSGSGGFCLSIAAITQLLSNCGRENIACVGVYGIFVSAARS